MCRYIIGSIRPGCVHTFTKSLVFFFLFLRRRPLRGAKEAQQHVAGIALSVLRGQILFGTVLTSPPPTQNAPVSGHLHLSLCKLRRAGAHA